MRTKLRYIQMLTDGVPPQVALQRIVVDNILAKANGSQEPFNWFGKQDSSPAKVSSIDTARSDQNQQEVQSPNLLTGIQNKPRKISALMELHQMDRKDGKLVPELSQNVQDQFDRKFNEIVNQGQLKDLRDRGDR